MDWRSNYLIGFEYSIFNNHQINFDQMADSFNKKEREKRKRKKQKEKAERKKQRKLEGNKTAEFMYVDENGNLSSTPPNVTSKREINIEDIEISTPKQESSEHSKYLKTGYVKFFNSDKGYGFVIDKETNESYFAHTDNLVDKIKDKDKVMFEIGKGPKGPIAINVRIITDNKES